MSKGLFLCCLVLLTTANLASGQPAVALPQTGPLMVPPDCALGAPVPLNPGPAAPAPAPWFVTTEADFLLWLTQGERPSRAAVLSGPATIGVPVGLGNVNRNGSPLTGGRFALGLWLADYDPVLRTLTPLAGRGGEVRGFFLGERAVEFQGGVSVPGVGSSTLAGRSSFDLWGLEANGRCNGLQDSPGQMIRVDLLAGFRQLNFEADLAANRRTVFESGILIDQTASYSARNRFFGGQVGVGFQLFTDSNLTLGGDFKLAMGTNFQDLKVKGQVQTIPDLPALTASPFPADRGSFSRNTFSYVPELHLYMALPLHECITVRAGYTFFYWGRIARAADQIDLSTPGAGATFEVFRQRGLVVQGVDFGLVLSF